MKNKPTDHIGKCIHRGRILKGLHVEFTIPVSLEGAGSMTVEWEPEMPNPITEKIMKRYLIQRDIFLLKLAKEYDTKVLCIDV